MCCAIKCKEITLFTTNCHLAQLVGLSHGGKTGFREFPKVLTFFFFLSSFPLFLGLGLWLGLGFEPKRSNSETISQSFSDKVLLSYIT